MATSSLRTAKGRGRAVPAAKAPAEPPPRAADGSSTWMPAFAGSLLFFAAFPPIDTLVSDSLTRWAGTWPLAWLAPAFWVLIVRRPALAGRRPYLVLWCAGFAYWSLLLYWLWLPYPPFTGIGWLAMSIYLGCYLPAFVAVCRVAVHRLSVPVIVAAPVAWAGLELAQSHLLTGFNMAALGHSQWRWLSLIQIADLAGGYAVGFVVMLVAACLARMVPIGQGRWTAWPLLPAAAMLAVAVGYGYWRLDHPPGRTGPTIALIQGSIDIELKHDPARQREIYPHYFELSERALEEASDLDLIVWPETMYRDSLLSMSDDAVVPDTWRATLDEVRAEVPRREAEISRQADLLRTPLLLGIDYLHLGPRGLDHYNSALFVSRTGELGPRYDKMHPVLFGEYVPLAKRFGWLAGLSPIGAGIEWGTETPEFRVGDVRIAANICYESALPHVIHNQVASLRKQGTEPDVLVNLTNDGWFKGSSELDLHLTCGVFRAVECRKPFLIAANTGFSAWIDSDGRILERGPRRASDVLIARPQLDDRHSPYLAWGDWPAGTCLSLTCCVGAVGIFRRRSEV